MSTRFRTESNERSGQTHGKADNWKSTQKELRGLVTEDIQEKTSGQWDNWCKGSEAGAWLFNHLLKSPIAQCCCGGNRTHHEFGRSILITALPPNLKTAAPANWNLWVPPKHLSSISDFFFLAILILKMVEPSQPLAVWLLSWNIPFQSRAEGHKVSTS